MRSWTLAGFVRFPLVRTPTCQAVFNSSRVFRRAFALALFSLSPVTAQSPTASGPATGDSLIVGNGDVIKVVVWREKDLAGSFKVNENGDLTIPLVGTRHAAGMRWSVLYDSLMTEYRRVLRQPAVNLTLLRPVYVFGEVTKPGLYEADPTMSLAAVVALAGGARPEGDLGKLRVVRNGQTLVKDVSIDSPLLQAGVQSQDQIFIDRRGWFDRNSTFLAGSVLSIASILVTVLHR